MVGSLTSIYEYKLFHNIIEIKAGSTELEMSGKASNLTIISKMYCSSSQVVLVVRRRPHVINGGGFVVTDCSQKVVFKVDGCGVLGIKGELIVRDGNGDALVLIRRKVIG